MRNRRGRMVDWHTQSRRRGNNRSPGAAEVIEGSRRLTYRRDGFVRNQSVYACRDFFERGKIIIYKAISLSDGRANFSSDVVRALDRGPLGRKGAQRQQRQRQRQRQESRHKLYTGGLFVWSRQDYHHRLPRGWETETRLQQR